MRKSEAYFLRVAASSEDLAAPVAEILRQHHPTLQPQTMIIAPPQEYAIVRQNRLFTLKYGQRTTPERTLIFGEDRLLVIEKQPDSTLAETIIPFDQLVQVEMAVILLYSYVSFTWLAGDVRKTLKIEYNSVGDSIIRVELQRLWMTMRCPESDLGGLASPDWTAILNALPLKFGNYLQYALFPGEPVLQVIFQPTISHARRSRRSRFAEDRTLALTPEGLIVLEEARHVMHYGMIIRYFPLKSIRQIRFEPTGDQVWLRLSSGAAETDEIAAVPLSERNAVLLHEALLPFTSSTAILWATEAMLSPTELSGSR